MVIVPQSLDAPSGCALWMRPEPNPEGLALVGIIHHAHKATQRRLLCHSMRVERLVYSILQYKIKT